MCYNAYFANICKFFDKNYMNVSKKGLALVS